MEQERVRFWQGFSLALALLLIATAGDSVCSVFAQTNQKQRFTEVDVERINVIEADGTVKLVIANRERAPTRSVRVSPARELPTTSPPASRFLMMLVTRRAD
jgi:hypothetical protein